MPYPSHSLFQSLAVLVCLSASALPALSQSGEGKKKPSSPIPASVRTWKPVDMKVASIDRSTREDVRRRAAAIDALVERGLTQNGLSRNSPLDEEQYVRRMFLELGGRIPRLEETLTFINSEEDEKRDELVDLLLESPDYVSHFYNFWADILRLIERPQPNMIADPYLGWVKESIAANKPYDSWVYEMLTADGKMWENPAVGFQLRDDGMRLPYVDNTVRVFLGTQIGCAQCHDHPFDEWTQRQFYELAAYTAGVQTRIVRGDPGFEKQNPANSLINEKRKISEQGRVPGSFQRVVRANTYRVSEGNRKLKLPHDYAYSDGKPNEVVEPNVLWGEVPSSASPDSRRDQFARWVTSKENPRFAATIANRMWKKMMGVGLVEPHDDFSDENPPTDPELLEHLSQLIIELDFDTREFIRILAYTDTYRREAEPFDPSGSDPFRYPGPVLRRMTAEQTWDSILTLAVYNPWPFQRPTAAEMYDEVNIDFGTASLEEVEAIAEAFEESYFRSAYQREMRKHAYKGEVLVRASEMPTPLPLRHFLRQFGQGDRETIEGSAANATVPQILTMFNGPVTHMMLERGSKIYDDVLRAGSRGALDTIFLTVLSRQPTRTDRKVALQEIATAKTPAKGIGNVIWSLLNTREFLFIQ